MLDELKSRLRITWNEEDEYLQKIIDRGKAYLNSKAGIELDFDTHEIAQQLLLDYCRYDFNNSIELFPVNFKNQLLELSINEGVRDHVEKNREADS
ncbi:phage head-tail connector protein (plasmid) [Bacillus carboniphilus]|uniref:Phage head-tail connector protein n=1 Tax=Bacillus carboniphilus TaxID=86663 RepID=A0ABY9K3I7_9BACI|nr:phage head-tail connector protein [Bacillus carboniphilus]WLR44476.1 phage head-tail connector protein [Bacillus carboniphilus]